MTVAGPIHDGGALVEDTRGAVRLAGMADLVVAEHRGTRCDMEVGGSEGQ